MASLREQNPWLGNANTRARALRLAAASSSAVEGIRKPFNDKPIIKPAPRKPRKSA